MSDSPIPCSEICSRAFRWLETLKYAIPRAAYLDLLEAVKALNDTEQERKTTHDD